jgi:hypothetical protein
VRAALARERTIAQWFCLAFGAALVLRGTIGVAMDPEFGTPGEGWHQGFHLLSGVALVAAAGRARTALAATLAFATTYALITVVGIANGSEVAGVIPVAASDNLLHSVFTVGSFAVAAATLLRGSARTRPAT